MGYFSLFLSDNKDLRFEGVGYTSVTVTHEIFKSNIKGFHKMAKKAKLAKIDGLGPDDIKKIRAAVRQVWTWSHAYRLAKKRNIGKDGFPRCEQCRKKVPKTYVDHLVGVGAVDSGFIYRMFVPSSKLQNLCKKCHQPKTNKERAEMRRKEKEENFF